MFRKGQYNSFSLSSIKISSNQKMYFAHAKKIIPTTGGILFGISEKFELPKIANYP